MAGSTVCPSSFPLCSRPISSVAEWILLNNYAVSDLLNYLDDFITTGPPDSPLCTENLSLSIRLCHVLGFPLHPGKHVGATTSLVVLGIGVRFGKRAGDEIKRLN